MTTYVGLVNDLRERGLRVELRRYNVGPEAVYGLIVATPSRSIIVSRYLGPIAAEWGERVATLRRDLVALGALGARA